MFSCFNFEKLLLVQITISMYLIRETTVFTHKGGNNYLFLTTIGHHTIQKALLFEMKMEDIFFNFAMFFMSFN